MFTWLVAVLLLAHATIWTDVAIRPESEECDPVESRVETSADEISVSQANRNSRQNQRKFSASRHMQNRCESSRLDHAPQDELPTLGQASFLGRTVPLLC